MTDQVNDEELSPIQILVETTIYDLKQRFGETRITANTIHLILKEVIELVDHFLCPGSEKKEHVITIVKALANDLVDNVHEKRIILEMIDKRILENTVDLIILATKGELNINNKKTQKKITSCCKSFIPIVIDSIIYIINSVNERKAKRKEKRKEKRQETRQETKQEKRQETRQTKENVVIAHQTELSIELPQET